MTRFQTLLRTLPLLVAAPTMAQVVEMQAYLDPEQENAGVVSDATGFATVTVDTATNTLTFDLSFQDLSSTQTAGHIHGAGAPGSGAGVALNFGVGNPVAMSWNYPQSAEADILGGLYYFNIHSQMFTGGEIRGQICVAPSSYCACAAGVCGNASAAGGCNNSTGQGGGLSTSGLASVAIDSLELTASNLPANQNGLFFMGTGTTSAPFGDGERCVGGQVFRFPIQNSGAAGIMQEGPGLVAFSQLNFSAPGQIAAGDTFFVQCWYRDPGGPCGSNFNLTDAMELVFTP